MRENGGRIVLMDFGAGRAQGADAAGVAGTPMYLAPEVLAGEPPTPASDLYSLGVLLFHLLTGKFPYSARTSTGCARRMRTGSAPGFAICGRTCRMRSFTRSNARSIRIRRDDSRRPAQWSGASSGYRPGHPRAARCRARHRPCAHPLGAACICGGCARADSRHRRIDRLDRPTNHSFRAGKYQVNCRFADGGSVRLTADIPG